MARKSNFIRVRSASDIADTLGLSKEDSVAMEFRARLNKKIVDIVKNKELTHAEVAKRAKASRTRITAILNGHTQGASTDFLLRILYSLGYKTTPVFSSSKVAA